MHVFEVFMQKMRYRLLIEYDGHNYAGWQIQKGQRTIQGEIEHALYTIFKSRIRLTGGGRTDSGVHARGQSAHFDFTDSYDCERLQRSLNGILDEDIRIKAIERVSDKFHARYSAREREYRYYICRKPVALQRAYCWYIAYPLNVEQMKKAARMLLDMDDFRAYCKLGSGVKHYRCEIKKVDFLQNDDLLTFIIVANRFLYGMVRSLVGALVDIGRGRLLAGSVFPTTTGITWQLAPAQGLVLERIEY